MEQFPSIIEADKAGDLNAVQQMIANGADASLQDKDGVTALMHAVYENKPDIVECLLSAGTNINLQGPEGFTALMFALACKNFLIAQRLLQAGADANLHNKTGKSTLMVAARKARDEVIVQSLVVAGVDVNHLDNDGRSALMYAAQRSTKLSASSGKIMQCLLQAGARVNQCDQTGINALMLAASREREICYEPLIDALMRVASDDQRNRILSFMFCIKYVVANRASRKDIFALFKPHLLDIVMQENRANPGKSFVWNMISACRVRFDSSVLEETFKKLYTKVLDKCPSGTSAFVQDKITRTTWHFDKEQNEVKVSYSKY